MALADLWRLQASMYFQMKRAKFLICSKGEKIETNVYGKKKESDHLKT